MINKTDSILYQKAMDLGVEIYGLVKKLPPEEKYVLSELLMRNVADIATNIAKSELDGENPKPYLSEARGIIAAVETQLLICVRVNYLGESDIEVALELCSEVERMLNTL